MSKFEVLRTGYPSTYDLKCPVCGTVDDLDEFIIHFYRCKMCRTDLAVVEKAEA